jgi:RNA-binding protein YlmH
VSFLADGGYRGAERQRVAFVHDDFFGEPDFKLACVKVTWNDKFYNLSHRDVLGALMGLGIKRETCGDILMKQDHAKLIAGSDISKYILQNFTKIGSATVTAEECSLDEIEPKEERCKEIKATVASMRLDSVASSGFGTSRSRIAADIAADKVRVNWQPVKNAAQTVKEGDIISMRGRGRVEVAAITGTTKKGRLGILLKRYI